MKKFNALLFTMALVAVVAFASVASATTFVGVDTSDNTELITVDSSAGTVGWSNLPGYEEKLVHSTIGAAGAGSIVGHKFLSYPGVIVAVSADASATVTEGDQIVLFKVADDKTVTKVATKKLQGMATGTGGATNVAAIAGYALQSLAGIKSVVVSGDNLVFLAESAISIYDGSNFVSLDVSADTAFVYNSKLYLINSCDAGTASHINEISSISTSTTSKDFVSTNAALKGVPMAWKSGPSAAGNADGVPGAFHTAIVGTYAYVANETGLYRMSLVPSSTNGIVYNETFAPKVEQVFAGVFKGMAADDGGMYLLEEANGKLVLKSFFPENSATYGVTIYDKVSDDVLGSCLASAGENSFDIYYDATDKVVAVVNQGFRSAFYTLSDNTAKCIASTDRFPSLAIVETASSSTDDGKKEETTTSTVVDATKITDETQVANLTKASGAAGTSAFVAQSDVTESTGTAPSTDTQTAVKEKAGFDNSTVAAVKDYTLAKKGYVLVTTNPGYNAANVKVYFVKKASSSSASVAAAEESFTASLLDSSYAAISTGTSAYATSTSELEAGDYTLVTVTKTASGEGEGEGESGSTTSSSSGGCNAGFAAVSALLALAFVKKSR